MTEDLPLEVTDVPDGADAATILDELSAFNAGEVGPSDRRPLGVFFRPAPGEPPEAGLTGYTAWNWLFTGNLWIAERHRGRGLAARLLDAAEAEALHRGCRGAWIDTFNPKAKAAYERCGYAVFGELPDFVAGRSRFFLAKPLGP
ncbi:GNAT family N-acetyltransferase [Aureimonas leprariae]|uniref:N-acetyltransferase n=1 Tax=Plantimonas leprariae TaxID=2615207 RepID=A0A7V7PPK9_9HYPH|nr:GNAT family N-acetyltransferase [Aureimonas leprariae]KAB0679924.1 N-acetyltransferase [Aureimonas leprariae]